MPDGKFALYESHDPRIQAEIWRGDQAQSADQVYPDLRRAKRLLDAGMKRLQNALDKCPGGYTYELLEMAEDALKDDATPALIDALERVAAGDMT